MFGQHTISSTKGARKTSKRLGRGNGSGKGNFSGKGMKGQKARTGKKIKAWFEGGQTPMAQRMPKLRGFLNPNGVSYNVINIDKIAKHFPAGSKVDAVALADKNLIPGLKNPVKLLAVGEITHAVEIIIDAASASAKKKIEKAGGTCTTLI